MSFLDKFTAAIEEHLTSSHRVLKIGAPTGTGKSTTVPLILHDRLKSRGLPARVIVSLPTIESVRRLYNNISERFPDYRTGYSYAGEKHYSKGTDIVYATSGHVRNTIVGEREVFDVYILDESHTGSMDNSVIAGTWMYRYQGDESKRIVFMTATQTRLPRVFEKNPHDVKEITVQAEHSLKVVYQTATPQPKALIDTAIATVESIVNNKTEEPGTILLFVATVQDVIRVSQLLLWKGFHGYAVRQAYAELGEELNDLSTSSAPKIIVCTNVLESSITIPDVKAVVDTMKEVFVENTEAYEEYRVRDITHMSSLQRKGRTGRTRDGTYYPMMSKNEYSMLKLGTPEIMRLPIDKAVLQLLNQEDLKDNAESILLSVDASSSRYVKAVENLIEKGLLDQSKQDGDVVTSLTVTPQGRTIARTPLSLESSYLLLKWKEDYGTSNISTLLLVLSLVKANLSRFFKLEAKDDWSFYSKYDEKDSVTTLVNIYRELWPQNRRYILGRGNSRPISAWCRSNKINDNVFLSVLGYFKEFLGVTYSVFGKGTNTLALPNYSGLHQLTDLLTRIRPEQILTTEKNVLDKMKDVRQLYYKDSTGKNTYSINPVGPPHKNLEIIALSVVTFVSGRGRRVRSVVLELSKDRNLNIADEISEQINLVTVIPSILLPAMYLEDYNIPSKLIHNEDLPAAIFPYSFKSDVNKYESYEAEIPALSEYFVELSSSEEEIEIDTVFDVIR